MNEPQAIHPKGSNARVLLTSVFGPYAQDDEFGSRAINPMELYQNQVTRLQGVFSLRMFHRSFGLLMIQDNIQAPCTVLDFPSLNRFIEEIQNTHYDIIGIGAIVPNIGKVKAMCELIRRHQPRATIVIGGHITNLGHIDTRIDADQFVRGDGIHWFRKYLGEDPTAPIHHPAVPSAFGCRILGVDVGGSPENTAAILVPSVGCPVGCNFCSTSAHFGGKGCFINFFETGDALFKVMCDIEAKLRVHSFFVLDENFLLHRKRALRLLELMQEHGKSWSLFVFSSARVLMSYTMEQLIGLGVSFVWMGLEGENSEYGKLKGVDTKALVLRLQSHGIRVLGSSIIGLENHTEENIDGIIDHAVSHNTVFHQFMLYTPIPGTPLYAQHREEGRLLPEDDFSLADTHGQYRFNYRHRHIPAGKEETFLLDAFRRDFDVNGPSLARMIRVLLNGWRQYGKHPDPRIRKRIGQETENLRSVYAGAAWATRKWYRKNDRIAADMDTLLHDLYDAFGWKTRFLAFVIGQYAYVQMRREEKRLARGWCYEPASYYEKNEAALDGREREKPATKTQPQEKPGMTSPIPAA